MVKKNIKIRHNRSKASLKARKLSKTDSVQRLIFSTPVLIGLCFLILAFIWFGFHSIKMGYGFMGGFSFLMAFFWCVILIFGVPYKLKNLFSDSKKINLNAPKFILWLILVLAALILGSMGQMQVIQDRAWPSLGTGLGFYLGGIILFVVAMWLFGREGLKNEVIPVKLEWVLFGLIMLTAIVLRVIQLDKIPAGIFIDRGFAGYGGLRIFHEHFIPPLTMGAPLDAPTAILWVMAAWFSIFKNTQANLYLLVALISLSSFPFIYWFYRQLVGSRVALLAFYLLAVMRWNINFSRNGFTCIEIIVFMFATLALLMYGLKKGKLWIFVLAGLFCAGGLYTYQSYKAFPVLVALLGVYEFIFNFRQVKKNWLGLVFFTAVFFAVAWPVIHGWIQNGSIGNRYTQLSIISEARQEKSLSPIINNWVNTAFMFNWQGDPNPRHNLSNYRELDDVSGIFFVFGVFYALSGFWRRKNYYILTGLFIMSLPCLLSVDAAHSCRMVGITPFVTLVIAVAMSAIWGRVRRFGRGLGEIVFLSILIVPLAYVASQNAYIYFVKQANDNSSWQEYSTPESFIGKKIAANGNAYEYYISPIYYDHFTIDFLAYFYLKHVHSTIMPDALWPQSIPEGEGIMYILPWGRTGILKLLQSLYPDAKLSSLTNLINQQIVYYLTVSPAEVDADRGLKGKFVGEKTERAFPNFPMGLPSGPYHASFYGSMIINQTGAYQFKSIGNTRVILKIGGHVVVPGKPINLLEGYYPVNIEATNKSGDSNIEFVVKNPKGEILPLDPGCFTSLVLNKGLKASYYRGGAIEGKPQIVQMEPLINDSNGNDFALNGVPVSIHWTGVLNAPRSGVYHFEAETMDKVILKIDHHVMPMTPGGYVQVKLMAGPHSFDAYYFKPSGMFPSFSLLWIPPGEKTAEVVPNSVFGQVF